MEQTSEVIRNGDLANAAVVMHNLSGKQDSVINSKPPPMARRRSCAENPNKSQTIVPGTLTEDLTFFID